MGFAKGQQEQFADFMRTEKRFYRDTPEQLLEHYKGVLSRINDLLPAFFHAQPKCPLEILSRTDGPSAFYLAGTADGKRPGRFYVNVSHCEKRSVCDAVALALHEGVPGHHMQVAQGYLFVFNAITSRLTHDLVSFFASHSHPLHPKGDDCRRKPLHSLLSPYNRRPPLRSCPLPPPASLSVSERFYDAFWVLGLICFWD